MSPYGKKQFEVFLDVIEHMKSDSIAQEEEHPSPSILLPSSQGRMYFFPSPQISRQTESSL
jgi:hypothetical protein